MQGPALDEHDGTTEWEAIVEARRVARQIDSGESYDPGNVAIAVETYRELYRELLDYGPTAGTPL